jgi:hypothetical protein
MLIFRTNSVSDVVLALTVATLMNSIPKMQLLLRRNPEDGFFIVFRAIMCEVPELVLAVWKLWVITAQKISIQA